MQKLSALPLRKILFLGYVVIGSFATLLFLFSLIRPSPTVAYSDAKLGISLRYPESFVVDESGLDFNAILLRHKDSDIKANIFIRTGTANDFGTPDLGKILAEYVEMSSEELADVEVAKLNDYDVVKGEGVLTHTYKLLISKTGELLIIEADEEVTSGTVSQVIESSTPTAVFVLSDGKRIVLVQAILEFETKSRIDAAIAKIRFEREFDRLIESVVILE